MKRILIYVGICSFVFGSYAWWYFRPERVVKREVLSLISTLEIPADTGRTARMMKANRLNRFFSQEVKLDTPFPEASGTLSSNDLASGYSVAAEHAGKIIIQPEDDMEIRVDGKSAEVRFHLHAEATIGRWIKPVNGRYFIEMHYEKTQDGWQISRSSWVEAP
jgi:hypothetical protein